MGAGVQGTVLKSLEMRWRVIICFHSPERLPVGGFAGMERGEEKSVL